MADLARIKLQWRIKLLSTLLGRRPGRQTIFPKGLQLQKASVVPDIIGKTGNGYPMDIIMVIID